MGQKKARTVKCPICNKVQSTDGKEQFICCHKNHNIIENIYVSENVNKEVEKNDMGLHNKAGDGTVERTTDRNNVDVGKVNGDISTDTQKEGITFIGGNENMPENVNEGDEYTCQDCGSPLSKGQKYCPTCGKEMNWDGIE